MAGLKISNIKYLCLTGMITNVLEHAELGFTSTQALQTIEHL